MKYFQNIIYSLLASSFIMSSALAHDPSKHTKKMEKPKCEALESMELSSMEQSSMDMNDPVMKAIMKKCLGGKLNESIHSEEAIEDSTKKSHKGQSQ